MRTEEEIRKEIEAVTEEIRYNYDVEDRRGPAVKHLRYYRFALKWVLNEEE